MATLEELREQIDSIDREIVTLLNRRMSLAEQVGEQKKANGLPVYHPEREQQIYERLRELNKDERFPDTALRQIYTEVISVSRQLQQPLSIAYLGPRATYTHMAVLKHFGSSVAGIPVDTISDIFREVETDKCEFGVVPIENSTEGIVTHTLDQFTDSSLQIVAEIFMNVSHCLLASIDDISRLRKVYSHPQSFSQCRLWLQNNLKGVEINETASNAKAASIAAWDKYSAAIASQVAADVYGLRILARHIEDNPNNTTRFLVIGKHTTPASGDDKTSLVCSVKDRPGALYDLLSVFSSRDINMTKIESRPTRKKAWEYLFFIDVDGHVDDTEIQAAIHELEGITQFIKILGAYPKGQLLN